MAAEPHLIIKFDGRDADAHAVDMRALGRALIGLDRIISDGIILITERRLPRHGERAHLIVKAQEPRQGSHEIVAFLQEHAGTLALGAKIFTESGGNIVWQWVSFVLEYFGGRKKEADRHLESLLQACRDQLAARDKSEERLVGELGAWRRDIMTLLGRQSRSCIGATAPVGPSVRTLSFSTPTSAKTVIDEPMADAIRAKGELESDSDHLSAFQRVTDIGECREAHSG